MEKLMKLAVQLTAVDKMSEVFKKATKGSAEHLDALQKKSNELFGKGFGLIGGGVGLAATMAPAISAFATLENSSTELATSMMRADGTVSPFFEKINKLAVSLGGKLPGTTADFQNLFQTLLSSGVKAESILGGVGKAAAYMAVNLKMDYVEAGKFAAKMKEATGTTDAEMLNLLDTLTRVKNLGVEVEEMRYAFGRSAGALKVTGIQGLEASKKMAAAYAIIIRSGLSGETVGTGFSNILNTILDPKKMAKMNAEAAKFGLNLKFTDKGEFLGIENMIAQLDKLKNLSAEQRVGIVNALSGGGQDAAMLQQLITAGASGFQKMQSEMAAQADLNTKVEAQLKTLSNIWEATTGAAENMLAAFGEVLGPELKQISLFMSGIAEKTQVFVKQYPKIFRYIGLFVGLTSVIMVLAGAVTILKGAFAILNVVMLANPVGLIIAGIAAAAAAVWILYDNWDELVNLFLDISWMKNVEAFFEKPWVKKVVELAKSFADIVSGAAALRSLGNYFDISGLKNTTTGSILTAAQNAIMPGSGLLNKVFSDKTEQTLTNRSIQKMDINKSYKPGTTLYFSPTITVAGGKDAGEAVLQSISPLQNEFQRMLENYEAQKRRKQF